MLLVLIGLLLYLVFAYRKEAKQLSAKVESMKADLGKVKSADEYYNARKYESDKLESSIENLKKKRQELFEPNHFIRTAQKSPLQGNS